MKIEEHIKNLEEYCQEDDLFEKDGDFKEFCDGHIADIKAVIEELKNTQSDLYEANNRINDLLDTIKLKDKVISAMAEDLNDFYDDIALEYKKRTIEDTIKKFEERCKDE